MTSPDGRAELSIAGRIRQWFCAHEVYLEDLKRHDYETDGFRHVEAPCTRCGKTLTAIYGLALPAKITRRALAAVGKEYP